MKGHVVKQGVDESTFLASESTLHYGCLTWIMGQSPLRYETCLVDTELESIEQMWHNFYPLV